MEYFEKLKNENEYIKKAINELKNVIKNELNTYKPKEKISEINTSYFRNKLKIGTIGNDVKELQTFLKLNKGINNLNGDTFGTFGKGTLSLLKEYLISKGYTGPVTLAGRTSFTYIIEDVRKAKQEYYEKQQEEKGKEIANEFDNKVNTQIQLEDIENEMQKKEAEKTENGEKEKLSFLIDRTILREENENKNIDKQSLRNLLQGKTQKQIEKLYFDFNEIFNNKKIKSKNNEYKKLLVGYTPKNEFSKKEIKEIQEILKKLVEGEAENTKEEVMSGITTEFLGIKGRKSKEEVLKYVNRNSLNEIIERGELGALTEALKISLKIDDLEKFEAENKMGFRNYTKMIPTLERYGYKIDGYLDMDEAVGIIGILVNVKKTQDKINTLKFPENLKIILDYNADGKLDNGVNFAIKEKAIFKEVKNEEQFGNLLKNLGYSSLDEFNKKFSENYFKARRDFKDRLGIILLSEDKVNPSKMIKDPNAVKDYLEFYGEKEEKTAEKAKNEVEKQFNSNPKFQNIEKADKGFFKKIKLEAVGILVGEKNGVGFSFNIQEATKKLIDSMQIGIINGVPGVGFSKNFYNKGRVRIDGGIVNIIPYVSSIVELRKKSDQIKSIFQTEVDYGINVNFVGAIGYGYGYLGLQLLNCTEETRNSIIKGKKETEEKLNKLFTESIEKGEDFNVAKNNKNNNLEEKDRDFYNLLKGLYESYGHNLKAKEVIIKGYLNNYERYLYENIEKKINIDSVGFGVAFIGTIAFPVINIEASRTKTTWVLDEKSKKDGQYIEGITNPNGKIEKDIKEIETSFDKNTRKSQNAIDLMEPLNNLEERWNGLKNLTEKNKKLKESKLGEIIKEIEKIQDPEDQKEGKWFVISIVSQYIKKAYDYEGKVSTWDMGKKIEIDKKRRGKFNTMFGFNADVYAGRYYKQLEAIKDTTKMGTSTIKSIGFDATSSIGVEDNYGVSGMDVVYSNLEMITYDGKVLLEKINETDKKGFINTIKIRNDILPNIKKELLYGLNNGDIELYFYKDPYGFDDRLTIKFTSGANMDLYSPAFDSVKFGVAAMFGAINPEKKGITGKDSTQTTETSERTPEVPPEVAPTAGTPDAPTSTTNIPLF